MKYCFFLICALFISFTIIGQNEDSSRFEIHPLNINSTRSDFSPFVFDNKIYFSSGRDHSFGVKYFNAETNQELIDVYYADKKDSVNYKTPEFLSKVNTKYNDGPICISKDGMQLFITSNDLKRAKGKDKKPLSIYVFKKINTNWTKPEVLPFCKEGYSYGHPALLNDGHTLIFASDMAGGNGGMDLYSSTYENEIWSAPKNLGAKINSADNEVFPFVSANNILYYSSNKRNRFLGLNIYTFDLKDVKNSKAKILSYPFNSDADDFGVWFDSTENTGYLSSNRDTINGDDIFYFKNKYPNFTNCTPQKKARLCYTFFEESTSLSDDTLGMTYEWDFGDGTKTRGIEVKHCFKSVGNYAIQLNVIEKASGNLFYNELGYDFTVEEPKQFIIDCPDTLSTGNSFSFDSKKCVIENHTIKEVYWFFGDERFAIGTSAQHAYRKDGTYIIQLGVVAKNDSTGVLENFCTQKTVLVKNSLWIKNHANSPYPPVMGSDYGANRILKNDSVNYRVHLGTSKEEISVNDKAFTGLNNVKEYKDKNGYNYTTGDAKKLADAIPDYEKAKQKGFKDVAVVGFKGDSILPHQEKSVKGDLNDIDIKALKTLHKRNVLFDVGKATIKKSYEVYLDSLVSALQENKKLELIIIASCDKTEDKFDNISLAKNRASVIQNYFVLKGIKSNRLEVIALGKNMPNAYEDKKIVVISNRRVEILLVKNPK